MSRPEIRRGRFRYSLAVRASERAAVPRAVPCRAAIPPDEAGTQYVGLDEVIPTASPAYLHNVYGEFVESSCQQDQFLRGRAEPETAPRCSPKTHDTNVNCSLRQIGHMTELCFP